MGESGEQCQNKEYESTREKIIVNNLVIEDCVFYDVREFNSYCCFNVRELTVIFNSCNKIRSNIRQRTIGGYWLLTLL